MVKKIGDIIHVNDLMQSDYTYQLDAPIGRYLADNFKPHFTPKKMLALGVFEGKYCNDCREEFPESWFSQALINETPDPDLNYFKIKSRQSLQVWQEKKWITGPDPRGWFQWYCRYYMGRRIQQVDAFQIKRWRAFARHSGQLKANCMPFDISCRPRQRQALLQWAYNPFI